MSRLFLVRHAAVDAQGRYWGATDLPLSRVGRAQLPALARAFTDLPLDVVFASDLVRARDTAASIAAEVTFDPRLREINFGACEGLTFDEIASRWPDVAHSLLTDPTSFAAPRCEAFADFTARVNAFVKEYLSETIGDVAVVAHRGSLALIAAAVLGRSPKETLRWPLPPAEAVLILR